MQALKRRSHLTLRSLLLRRVFLTPPFLYLINWRSVVEEVSIALGVPSRSRGPRLLEVVLPILTYTCFSFLSSHPFPVSGTKASPYNYFLHTQTSCHTTFNADSHNPCFPLLLPDLSLLLCVSPELPLNLLNSP